MAGVSNLPPVFENIFKAHAPELYKEGAPMLCSYCFKERETAEGWHDCSKAQDAKARIEKKIDDMTRIANGGRKPEPVKDDLYIGHTIKGMKAWDDGRED